MYAESSAILAWLLDETEGLRILESLSDADVIYASELTLVECDRALIRGTHLGDFTEAEAQRRRGELATVAASWRIIEVTADVTSRARSRFPAEPVRTLDALHLASALLARSATSELQLLALDDRVRRNGRALGFDITPEGTDV